MTSLALHNLTGGNLVTDPDRNAGRLTSAAKEFESILLGQWLKDAESSFGHVPGTEEDDQSGQQMKEFAMQHVATEMTERGGIGIAPMVERALAKHQTPHTHRNLDKTHDAT